MLHTLRFSLQNAVYFIMLPFLVHALFTFYIHLNVKLKVCKSVHHRTILCFVRGRADRSARPRTKHDCHHDTKVKPEAATAVTELLMMGRKTPETC
jgi:hypothetical protein